MLNVKGLARTSNTPGRTQALNFFLINRQFRFVDLPGYGYAKVPRAIKHSWGEMATNYLANRDNLVLSIHIVDSRHEPTIQDVQLHEWLQQNEKPHLTIATKSDKLSQNELRKNLERRPSRSWDRWDSGLFCIYQAWAVKRFGEQSKTR